MKISKLEFISILLAAVFLAFTGGWFLRGASQPQPVLVETERQLVQESPVVLMPAPSASVMPTVSAAPSASTAAAEPGKVDLNTATAEELMTLPGIGEKRAEAIIAYREANGPFRIPEELTEVDGIGEGILAGLIDQVTVS
ncbi:ComEA family DNA-binding protein [Flavonifractor sp. HCP28S3_F3]|uniref:ComEA family DNA-binding protein n=1 Tax=Flavonifractor sp. HCP28S3_F3 TaxID=3438939 RepID=UPI003F8ACEE1